ncbi:XRE family transcriptional regulator [Mesorhizobium sp. PUT5]|uniref:XRE family transcriptional regulator n=1 Tax=Mesorhizobium sp. PUT5 TaxID=3454629 RepID=UPI003FA44F8D
MKGLIKAGRDLLGITQAELCDMAGVPLITLRRIEGKPDHAGLVSQETVERIKAALEKAGIQFLEKGSAAGGSGVALRKGAAGDGGGR